MCQGGLVIYSNSYSRLIGGNAARPITGIVASDLTLDIGLGKSWLLVCFCIASGLSCSNSRSSTRSKPAGPSDRATEAGCLLEQNDRKGLVERRGPALSPA
ncbi:hypothetical protein TNIN_169801 [Trichonephila inaurata madagascariensis]|uniref:Uncharacterized protein n=1 Tax=Trichonephila inaurata madagascariensis TaxID=2747483 RepID=A0A8X6YJ53_9ARAC|nr:hypothetical protein TNIN_169801 [Trichonephila inaurata madagascariensis]